MFCSHKNSYLQLVCAMNPRVINKAVDEAMEKPHFDPHTERPPAQRLESMQPSLFGPHVDISRARLGFGRIGLRLINRDLHSPDSYIQLQALHTILDEVQISESALFLINLNLVYRLIDLMQNRNPIIREKVCLILTHLASYYQGRNRIMRRPELLDNLLWLIMRDRKEIRYAATYTLRTLSRDRCSCEKIMQNEKIIESLLKMVRDDYVGIVIMHMKTLENLIEWDPEKPLKKNAFRIMISLFSHEDNRIVCGAMDCMKQLCKHNIGKKLADEEDMIYLLRPFLHSRDVEVIISTVGILEYTTLTTRSKWRAKECCTDLTSRLVELCYSFNKPLLQLCAMQVLINLCDCPDIRNHVKQHWLWKIRELKIRTHEDWDGTTETSSYGLETGHNYRTMCIENIETIKNDYGDNAEVLNVHSYLRHVQTVKYHLIKAINFKCYRD